MRVLSRRTCDCNRPYRAGFVSFRAGRRAEGWVRKARLRKRRATQFRLLEEEPSSLFVSISGRCGVIILEIKMLELRERTKK